MDTINIYGDNRYAQYSKIREACRGVVIQDNKILMTYAVAADLWMIPGGGREDGESLEQCCIRELEEETGFVVDPLRSFATINEFYGQWLYRSHYYFCEITGETGLHLTAQEVEAGLETRWIPLEDAIGIFSKHYEHVNEEMKRGAYLREYSALLALTSEVSI